jgi:hypothetical protein
MKILGNSDQDTAILFCVFFSHKYMELCYSWSMKTKSLPTPKQSGKPGGKDEIMKAGHAARASAPGSFFAFLYSPPAPKPRDADTTSAVTGTDVTKDDTLPTSAHPTSSDNNRR